MVDLGGTVPFIAFDESKINDQLESYNERVSMFYQSSNQLLHMLDAAMASEQQRVTLMGATFSTTIQKINSMIDITKGMIEAVRMAHENARGDTKMLMQYVDQLMARLIDTKNEVAKQMVAFDAWFEKVSQQVKLLQAEQEKTERRGMSVGRLIHQIINYADMVLDATSEEWRKQSKYFMASIGSAITFAQAMSAMYSGQGNIAQAVMTSMSAATMMVIRTQHQGTMIAMEASQNHVGDITAGWKPI